VKAVLPTKNDIFRLTRVGMCLFASALLGFSSCKKNQPIDEAKAAGKTTADFPQITADIFKPMDGGIELSPKEVRGRNTWNLWSAGNQRFWDRVAHDTGGLVDLLKMLDNRKYRRDERFKTLGLINQPGFRAASKADEFGLWLDEEVEQEPAGINENVYGKPSGVLGFRLFPNPDFDQKARKNWDGAEFMCNPSYYKNRRLIRPYRIGVACGACHNALNPSHPPIDPEHPRWEDLASTIGNQYLNEGKVFACNAEKGDFFYEELSAQPRGTSDTSRIATDHINNPNAINAIFLLAERERICTAEKMAGGTLSFPGEKETMCVPHILKDGADSIGIGGAAIRVYVNIGMFSEYWLTLHNALIGLTPQHPFEIPYAREHSVYWLATEERLPYIAAFFRNLKPYHLADAPGGRAYITCDQMTMNRGKEVFAERCAACHSSKQPTGLDPRCAEAKAWFRAEVMKADFSKDNFLSNDRRYPVTDLKTNTARAFATNAKSGHIWDNFSSQTYKDLDPVEPIQFYNPFETERPIKFSPRQKNTGPGYYRVPSLASLWSSAPLFHNNALGKFTGDPSVAGRMEAFNDAIEKLLWPEKRSGKDSIWRTQNESSLYLRFQSPFSVLGFSLPDRCLVLGPIPKGTPINLIANLEPDHSQITNLAAKIGKALFRIHSLHLSSEEAATELLKTVPESIAANKCPDFVEDNGHYFGTDLSDNDKRALIEFLKTL